MRYLIRSIKYAFVLLLVGWAVQSLWFHSLPRLQLHAGSHPLNVVVADTPVSQVRAFLDQRKDRDDDNNNCAWVEGLADALGALSGARQGDSVLAGQARAWVATQMRKVALLQVRVLARQNSRPPHAAACRCFCAGLQAASTQVDSPPIACLRW